MLCRLNFVGNVFDDFRCLKAFPGEEILHGRWKRKGGDRVFCVVCTRRFGQRENKWSKEHDQFDTSGTREFSRAVNNFSQRPSTSSGYREAKKKTTKCCRIEEG